MAPKKVKSERAAGAEAPPEPVFNNPNTDWHDNVTLALDTIKGYFGLDIMRARPLTEAEGAPCPPADVDLIKDKLENVDEGGIVITGGINVLNHNMLFSLTPNVRINVGQVDKRIDQLYGDGRVKPLSEPVDFLAEKGEELVRLSPEEPVHALVIHIARRISDPSHDEAELEAWRKVLLTTPARFVKATTWDSQYFWAVNRRRETVLEAKTVQHLASQIAADIWLFKRRKEAFAGKTFTNEALAQLYAEHLLAADSDEEPRSDPILIGKAIVVYEKILSNAVIAEVVRWCEAEHGVHSPFNSLVKLYEVWTKCKKASVMEFVFTLFHLGLLTDQLEAGDLSINKLKGSKGSAGLLDVALLKNNMKQYFLGRWMDTQSFVADHKGALRKMFDSPSSYKSTYLEPCPAFYGKCK